MKYNAESFNPNKTLKRVREQSGMTQKQFADAIGITEDKLKRIENRKNRTGISILEYLNWCDNYDCDINFLLGVKAEPTDVCSVTGLNPDVVELLKKEKEKPFTSEIRNGKDGVISGITTAELFNDLSGFKGMSLKETMLQYTRERMILNLLEESARNIVDHHNAEHGRSDAFETVVQFADRTMSSVRLMSSLSSLTVAGKMQKGIDDDFTAFCDKFGTEQYSKDECKVLFDYMQSRSRIEALKMKCYDLMMHFLDMLSEDSQLTLHHSMGDFEVTPSLMYEESVDEIGQAKNEMLATALKREMTKLKSGIHDLKNTNHILIESNNHLSAELNDERQKVRKLQKVIDSIPDDKKSLTELNQENAELKESVSKLFEANQGLDDKVKELEKELKQLKKSGSRKK